jgi:hypothetical protein
MTAPPGTVPSNNQPGGGPAAGITFDEIERQLKDAEKTALDPKLDDFKIEGEDIPDNLKGKSARELLNHIKSMEDTLRTVDQQRQQALTMAQLAAQGRTEAPPAPKVEEPEPLITSEQVAQAFQEDAQKGVELMNKMTEQQISRAGEHFMRRISPMLSGVGSAAENEARRKYPDEFDIYKDEIAAMMKRVDKAAMSTLESWDDLIAYVRGKDPMRLFNHMAEKDKTKAAADAQEQQRNTAGVSMSSSTRAAAPAGGPVMDATTLQICDVLGISPEDYIKWSKVS